MRLTGHVPVGEAGALRGLDDGEIVVGELVKLFVFGVLFLFLEVWFHAFGIRGGELGQGLFPVGGDPPLDETAFAFMAFAFPGLLPLSGPFVLYVADREPQELDDGLVVGELAAVAADLPQLIVQ
ncbi:hypothetical protein BHAP_1404 [Bifidobacterium hapali]|uniref:Uncharacterized protein n=1 Tax=Bifidobacterium hapali TaxID=1630172 RepID=A0A261FYL5_9BIFI|nr:hypothetical protein BHAP_1404 [Bifidobacterium hapali]